MHARPLAFASTLAVCLAACSDDEGFRLGALGMIDLRPTTAEFIIERVPLGESAEQTIAVHNIGTGDLRIDDVHIEVLDALGASPVVATLRAEPPLFVIANAASSQPITLTYTRVDDRPRRLQLVVESSDPRSPRAVVPLDVRPGAANLGAIPGQAIFALGDAPATKTIRLINAGNAPLALSRMRLEAPESFSVALAGNAFPPNVNDLVLDPPVVIAPGTEQSLVVDFDPGDDLPASGRVVLYGNSVNSREGFPVPLIGNQSGPCILVRPNVIAFGTKALDSVSDISADIENCGVVPLDITGIALSTADDDSGASSERFSLVDATPSATSPWRLEPGAVRATTVRYTAWTTGHSTLGPLPEVDRGTLLVHSNSRLPTRAVDITATTEVPERPTDIDGCEWGWRRGRQAPDRAPDDRRRRLRGVGRRRLHRARHGRLAQRRHLRLRARQRLPRARHPRLGRVGGAQRPHRAHQGRRRRALDLGRREARVERERPRQPTGQLARPVLRRQRLARPTRLQQHLRLGHRRGRPRATRRALGVVERRL
jgi:hypothetical protein